jgi:formamidopyrimidine-DNA glycosylase
MPELPEVETTCRGIEPHLVGREIVDVIVRQSQLRWPIPGDLRDKLVGCRVVGVRRRAKYILIDCGMGYVIVHLGMTGSLRIVSAGKLPNKHDHVDVVLSDRRVLRLHDPRRFGALLWADGQLDEHPLLVHLGPEPLHDSFTASYLYQRASGRQSAVKAFIMDGRVVVGVGNIYANEALFMAGIHPRRAAGRISLARYEKLVDAIKVVLARSIRLGGTTLRDFVNSDGKPGYFRQSLQVYGRKEGDCLRCGGRLKEIRQAQRSTVFCPVCQR